MKTLPWIICATLLGALVWQRFGNTPERHETVWDTIPVYDTIVHNRIVPRDSVVLRYELVRLPVVGNISMENIPKNGNIDTGNISNDSMTVSVPITQKHYRGDDYEAWVSGFCTRLDSIRLYPKRYYLKPKETKPKRWVLSTGVSVGWNPSTKQFEPVVGLSVGWKIWEW